MLKSFGGPSHKDDTTGLLREKYLVQVPQGSKNFVLAKGSELPKNGWDIQWYLSKSEKSQSCVACLCKFSPWQVLTLIYENIILYYTYKILRFMQFGIPHTL